jgi:phosphatidylethanolamine-binding protein (PEBP) family uncharacterized protein
MAPGRSAKRLLVGFAKAASTGSLLVLAVAAFLFAGCGGGSSSDTSAPTTTANSVASEAGDGGGNGAATGGGSVSSDAPSSAGAAGTGATGKSGGQPSSSSGKHGPPVTQPTGEREPGITPQQRREATVADMVLQSPSSGPAVGGVQRLSARYTCDGENTSPALRWKGVPEGTAELVLFAMNTQPVAGKLFFDWAVAGLSPELNELAAGKLPRGAIVGRNSFGKTAYGVCPESGSETYILTLFALPRKLSPSRGFDPLALRKAVTETSGNVGLLALGYARG